MKRVKYTLFLSVDFVILYISMNNDTLTFADVLRRIIAYKWRIIIITAVVTCIGIVYVVSLPRGYKAVTQIVAEKQQTSSLSVGMLGGLAGLGGGVSKGGITLELAPSIVRSIPFLLEFEDVQVSMYYPINSQTPASMPLSEYLSTYQRSPWWSFSSRKSQPSHHDNASENVPYALPFEQAMFVKRIQGMFSVTTEKKSNVMILSVSSQDPMVSVILVDSLAVKLQQYLTAYQVQKARQELEQSIAIAETTRSRYYQAQNEYTSLVDMNKNLTSLSARAKQDRAYNDMTIALQAYTSAAAQVEIARTKLLENTPVYTVLEPPLLDTSASSPNRKLVAIVSFVLGLFLGVGTVLFKDIWKIIMQQKHDIACD